MSLRGATTPNPHKPNPKPLFRLRPLAAPTRGGEGRKREKKGGKAADPRPDPKAERQGKRRRGAGQRAEAATRGGAESEGPRDGGTATREPAQGRARASGEGGRGSGGADAGGRRAGAGAREAAPHDAPPHQRPPRRSPNPKRARRQRRPPQPPRGKSERGGTPSRAPQGGARRPRPSYKQTLFTIVRDCAGSVATGAVAASILTSFLVVIAKLATLR